MDDLISRSALKKALRKQQIESLIAHTEKKNVFDVINEQPTAYDVEKVVGDLQKVSMIIEQNENSIKCAIEENMAVYIVKRGGVE